MLSLGGTADPRGQRRGLDTRGRGAVDGGCDGVTQRREERRHCRAVDAREPRQREASTHGGGGGGVEARPAQRLRRRAEQRPSEARGGGVAVEQIEGARRPRPPQLSEVEAVETARERRRAQPRRCRRRWWVPATGGGVGVGFSVGAGAVSLRRWSEVGHRSAAGVESGPEACAKEGALRLRLPAQALAAMGRRRRRRYAVAALCAVDDVLAAALRVHGGVHRRHPAVPRVEGRGGGLVSVGGGANGSAREPRLQPRRVGAARVVAEAEHTQRTLLEALLAHVHHGSVVGGGGIVARRGDGGSCTHRHDAQRGLATMREQP